MSIDLHLSGPTVTLFGDRDLLDAALSDELGRRGCSTHAVTTPTGWLTTSTNAVIRLDTPAGEHAMTDLVQRQVPATHVVAVCATSDDTEIAARLDLLSRQCGDRHDVSLIWHAPLTTRLVEDGSPALRPSELAASIVDEIGHQQAWTSAPSFTAQTFTPGRPPSRLTAQLDSLLVEHPDGRSHLPQHGQGVARLDPDGLGVADPVGRGLDAVVEVELPQEVGLGSGITEGEHQGDAWQGRIFRVNKRGSAAAEPVSRISTTDVSRTTS